MFDGPVHLRDACKGPLLFLLLLDLIWGLRNFQGFVLYYILLYCTALCYTILYFTILFYITIMVM